MVKWRKQNGRTRAHNSLQHAPTLCMHMESAIPFESKIKVSIYPPADSAVNVRLSYSSGPYSIFYIPNEM